MNTVWKQKATGRSADPYYYKLGQDDKKIILSMPVTGNTWHVTLFAGNVQIDKVLWLTPEEGLEVAKAKAIQIIKDHILREVKQWTGIQKIFNELVPESEEKIKMED